MLTEEQLAFYRENGYIHVKGLLKPEEAEHYRTRTHSLLERLEKIKNIDARWGSAGKVGGEGTRLLHSHDVQFYDAAFSQLIVDERITGIAHQIIGGEGVQLHHTKCFVKPPEKGAPFPMHQDAPFFPHEQHSMMAVILHFDDAPLEKGCLRVVPKSYREGMLEHIPDGGWHLPPDKYPVGEAMPCPAKAGDAIFFSYLTIHGSGLNVSDEARTTLLIQMRDPCDPPAVRTHESSGQGAILYGIDASCRTTKPLTETCSEGPSMGGGAISMGSGGAMGG
jgi:phytanoyl-CoA hydroxylase